ncbi:MAG: putative capsid protein [Persevirus truchatis]|uniref:Putative capsid protein n=1 Tax=Circoviridae sp. TaxID=1954248 RepID=A0A345N3B4_9VIRU|nr:MAG: putative capsid protein [Circoviridae sp.]
MRTYRRARRRSTRSTRRKRVSTRRKKSTTLATKAYVQKAITKKQESKMVQISGDFNSELESFPELWYTRHALYQQCLPGVTDRGRIGDTIYATGINVMYKIQAIRQIDMSAEESRPITFKLFVIHQKNSYQVPTENWFKGKDRGASDPSEPLAQEFVQNGLNVLNTDAFKILGHKNITIRPTPKEPYHMRTGRMWVPLRQMKINLQNNLQSGQNGIEQIMPLLWFVAYPYWGDEGEDGAIYQGKWQMKYSIQQHYKD